MSEEQDQGYLTTIPDAGPAHSLPRLAPHFAVPRRHFLRLGLGVCAGFGAGLSAACNWRVASCRTRSPNLFMQAGKPLMIVVKGEDLPAMLRAGLEALGGLDKLVSSGREAVLRANYVFRQPYPVTTSADMLVAASEELRNCGFQRTVLFDTHGTNLVTAAAPGAIIKKLGVQDAVQESGIEVVNADFFDREQFRLVRNPDWEIADSVAVHKLLHEAGVVIGFPVVKRHHAARFTCALKLHFGSVAMPDRLIAHKNGETGRPDYLDHRLVQFADAVRPQLNIVDARTLLTRSGPTLGGRSQVVPGVNRIILCGDMVATDAYCARLMAAHDETFSVEMIAGQLQAAVKLGIGTADLDKLRIVEIEV
jgi:uncharacterized protein (DUF362 family)